MRPLFRIVCMLGLGAAVALTSVRPVRAIPPAAPFADNALVDYPTDMPPIQVSVVRDGVDSRGHWMQTVRLTVRSGGTLADASLVVFGDMTHVDTLFQAARRANPYLSSPAMIPVGQQIDLDIDPATTFVLEAVLHGPNTLVQRFTNGVVNTVFLNPTGSVTRLMTFPDRKPTDFFAYPGAPGATHVRPGGRIVDLRYAKGESFASVVQETYGITTYAAAVDLTHQTGWDPIHWPPPMGEVKRVITQPSGVYQTQPTEVALIPNTNAIGRERQEALHQARRKAGVYAVRQESFGTVYHVAVTDPSITASQLSYLIYGSAGHQLDIARAAGYQIPSTPTGEPSRFDPHLLGRAFDLAVNYQDENFVAWRTIDRRGVTRVGLVDGAEITTYPSGSHGVVQILAYPTRYKLVVYRPSTLSLTIAWGLALFHVASDLTLSSDVANALARQYAAEVIWRWSPGMPRSPEDIPDSLELVDSPGGPVVRVLIGPPAPRTFPADLVDTLGLDNPLIAVGETVAAAAVIVLMVDLGRRHTRRGGRVRW